MDEPEKPTFEKELESLLNKYSKDSSSATPDFILADYLVRCLDNFKDTTKQREQWFGVNI